MIININLKVFDNNGVPLRNAEVRVNGQLAKHERTTGLHIIAGEVSDTIDLAIRAPGFQTVDKKGIALIQRPFEVYLGKEGDPWYADVNGIPVAYSSRPRDILVVLQDQYARRPADQENARAHILSLPELTGYEVLNVDWNAGSNTMSLRRKLNNKILLRAPSNLPASHVTGLASLRKHKMVQFSGPLIVHGEAYAFASAPGTKIAVYPDTQKMKGYEDAQRLAHQWACRYDMKEASMVFENDAGSVVIEATKAMMSSGLFSVVEMEMYKELELDR